MSLFPFTNENFESVSIVQKVPAARVPPDLKLLVTPKRPDEAPVVIPQRLLLAVAAQEEDCQLPTANGPISGKLVPSRRSGTERCKHPLWGKRRCDEQLIARLRKLRWSINEA